MVALSFDLYVWHEHGAVSADDARAKLQRRGEAGVFAAHPAVERFWSRCREVGAAIRAPAAGTDWCATTRKPMRWTPIRQAMSRRSQLSGAALPTVHDPDARRVEHSMNKVGRGTECVILERADGWFVQVGYGGFAGVPEGTYALEYREGSADRHLRSQTTDRTEAVRLLLDFLAGDETWKRGHVWRPLGD